MGVVNWGLYFRNIIIWGLGRIPQFPGKHEEFELQNAHKNQPTNLGVVTHTWNSRVEEEETCRSLGPTGQSAEPI